MKKEFGQSVRKWRNKLGLSQEALAERANLHRTYISDVERGSRNVSLESIHRLAQALQVSLPVLFASAIDPLGDTSKLAAANSQSLVDVLLVEDNPDDVELTLRAFRNARFANRIHVARDGAEALDYVFCRGAYAGRASAGHPQIILLDLDLPKVNGMEVLRELKSNEATRALPVVILTMSQRISNMTECKQLGADAYIVKPVNFQNLSAATPLLDLNWALLRSTNMGEQVHA